MKIKVCGMREPMNIEAVGAFQPDYMGFIFFERSPRFAGATDSHAVNALPAGITRVGVFVNAGDEEIRSVAGKYRLDAVQLHGSESPEQCARLRQDFIVIKAFGVAEAKDIDATKVYTDECDYFLFDAKTPAHGGSGQAFDHRILSHYAGTTPYFLSGGLSAEDTAHIASITDPRCVGIDVNSRFESAPGVKNVELLERFIKNIKCMDHE